MKKPAIVVVVLGGLISSSLAQTHVTPVQTVAKDQPLMVPTQSGAVTQTGVIDQPVGVPAQSDAVTILIRQAQRWLQENRPELAAISIQRALTADPRNAEALVVAAQVESMRNNPMAARGFLTRLQQVGSTPEQQAAAAASVLGASLDPAAIEQARALVRDGRTEEAAARYRTIFGVTGPTPPYAVEYYQALASSTKLRHEGVSGLSHLASEPGATDRTRLANAQTLTFQTATRADGIRQLAMLADQPDVGADARLAWRQALTFFGKDPAAVPLLEAYLAKYQDAGLTRQLEDIRTAPVTMATPGDMLRQQGFIRLQAGTLNASGQQFEAALAANPKDADAMGGLGIVRLREGKLAEARTLLSNAIIADPAGAIKWQPALDGASYGAELADARSMLRRGDLEGADSMARAAVRRQVPDQSDAEQLLGEIALRRRDPAAAEQHFRVVLARKPGFAPATTGLNQALRAQGQFVESSASEGTLPAALARARETSPTVNGTTAEVAGLRAEAARASDMNVAAALLRNAAAQAPNDPWTRLDLARVLRRQGRANEGRALMEEVASHAPSPDANFAAALFADEDGRPVDADTYLARIPLTRRTADMGRLQTRLRSSIDVARAVALLPNGGSEGRTQLITLAARPDPSGSIAVAVIRALSDAGDRTGSAEAARAAEAGNRAAGPVARIAIAGALLSAGLEREATVLINQLEQSVVTPEQRRDIASLRAGIDIRSADRLNDDGKQAEAFERLRPVLSRAPENADGQLALARLYQGARKPADALRVAEAVLMRDPRNLDARRSAVEAAIALGDRRKAESLVVDAEALTPNDSRVIMLQARIARGFGDETRARLLLVQAAQQRGAELGVSPASSPSGTNTGELANPFSGSAGLQAAAINVPQDATSRDIARETADVREETRPVVAGVPALRSRTGSGGLDKLDEYSTTAEATITPPGIDGRLTARLTPISIDEGKLTGNGTVLNKFGSNVAFGTSAVPNHTSAAGAGIGVVYNRNDNIKVELGTTPLGFPSTTFTGGVEIAPRLSDNVRLRIFAERRPVVDSLLSYAGTRDPVTGTRWGMVEHSGGHGQIEAGVGSGYVYAGGGYQVFDGTHVASNQRVDAGAGYGAPIFKTPDSELSSGINLIYFGYDKAVEGFTLGQGGYFSPQSFYGFTVPLDYRGKSGDFAYHLGAIAGYVKWKEDASPLFPVDSILQAQADAAARANPLIVARNQAQSRSGFTGGVRVDGDYSITPTLKLSGGVAYDKAANWNETRVTVRLQNKF